MVEDQKKKKYVFVGFLKNIRLLESLSSSSSSPENQLDMKEMYKGGCLEKTRGSLLLSSRKRHERRRKTK